MIQLPSYIGNGLEKLRTYLIGGEHCQATVLDDTHTETKGTIAAANATVSVGVRLANTVVMAVDGTFSATFSFQVSADNVNWYQAYVMRQSNRQLHGSISLSTKDAFVANVAGWNFFRVISTSYTSGSASVSLYPSASSAPRYEQFLPQGTNFVGFFKPQQSPSACAKILHYVSAATDNARIVRAGAGAVFGIDVSNTGATWLHLKLYDLSTVPLATDTPALVIGIAPNSARNVTFGDMGIGFKDGVGMRLVNGAANAATAVAAANQATIALQIYG